MFGRLRWICVNKLSHTSTPSSALRYFVTLISVFKIRKRLKLLVICSLYGRACADSTGTYYAEDDWKREQTRYSDEYRCRKMLWIRWAIAELTRASICIVSCSFTLLRLDIPYLKSVSEIKRADCSIGTVTSLDYIANSVVASNGDEKCVFKSRYIRHLFNQPRSLDIVFLCRIRKYIASSDHSLTCSPILSQEWLITPSAPFINCDWFLFINEAVCIDFTISIYI